MKKLIVLLVFLLVLPLALASRIDIDVANQLNGSIVYVNYSSSNALNVSAEIYNSGSDAYKARLRMDVKYDGGRTSVWSDERVFPPGKHDIFNLYWLEDKNNTSFDLRAYLGNEIISGEETNFSTGFVNGSDIFDVGAVRVFENRLELDVKSTAGATVFFMPVKYPPSWYVESARADLKNGTNTVVMPYSAGVWKDTKIGIVIFSPDGRYYAEKTVALQKKMSPLQRFMHLLPLFDSPVFHAFRIL